eukprot:44364_1
MSLFSLNHSHHVKQMEHFVRIFSNFYTSSERLRLLYCHALLFHVFTELFLTVFIIYCTTKLLWIVAQLYYFSKSILEEFSVILSIVLLLFCDIVPLVIFAFSLIIDKPDDDTSDDRVTNQDAQCRESTWFLSSYSFLSLPFHAIIIFFVAVIYPESRHNSIDISLYISCIIHVSINILSLIIISSNFWHSISRTISIYYCTSCVLDILRFIMTCYFVSIFLYNYSTHTHDNDVLFYCTFIVCIKTFILSPLYAITLFCFEFINEMHEFPYNLELAMRIYYAFDVGNSCLRRACLILCVPVVFLIYTIISLCLVFYIWIVVDSAFFIYPLSIFQSINDELWINSKGFDQNTNQWCSVVRYMNNSINRFDYNLRLFILNLTFYILDQNAYSKELLCDIQKGIRWYITDEIEVDPVLRCKPIYDAKSRQFTGTVTRTVSTKLRRPDSEPHKSASIVETEKDDKKSNTRDWVTQLNGSIFQLKYNEDEDEAHTLYGLIASEYTHLLYRIGHDLLPFASIFSMDDTGNGFEWFLREGSPDSAGKKYRFIREHLFTYFVLPLHVLLNTYCAVIYPLMMTIIYSYRGDTQMIVTFPFICCVLYCVLLIVMMYCMVSFVKFLNIWYLCLYRKTEHYQILTHYLYPLYEYVNTHKLKIDLIKKVFGPLSLEMLALLGYYIEEEAPNDTEQLSKCDPKQFLTEGHLTSHYMNPYSAAVNIPRLNLADRASDSESKTKSYLDSIIYQHSIRYQQSMRDDGIGMDEKSASRNLIKILPDDPQGIDPMLQEYGYYDSDNKHIGYSGIDFKGYKKTVHNNQTIGSQKMVEECTFVLFPLDYAYESNSIRRYTSTKKIELDFVVK